MWLIDATELKPKVQFHRIDGEIKAVVLWADVMKAPTIEAEPVKHARWKKSKKEKMYCDWEMNGWFDYPEICTNCGYDATEYGMGVGNYCPNCGARMDGE